jgi:hypothetical protein
MHPTRVIYSAHVISADNGPLSAVVTGLASRELGLLLTVQARVSTFHIKYICDNISHLISWTEAPFFTLECIVTILLAREPTPCMTFPFWVNSFHIKNIVFNESYLEVG